MASLIMFPFITTRKGANDVIVCTKYNSDCCMDQEDVGPWAPVNMAPRRNHKQSRICSTISRWPGALTSLEHWLLVSTCLLLVLTALVPGTGAISEAANCHRDVQGILERNNPEYILIPDNKDLNTFTNTDIQVNVNWEHIHNLIDLTCVSRYMVEFSPSDLGQVRHRRESVSLNADISPPLTKDTTRWTIRLPDNCRVYSFRLAVVLNEVGTGMLYSKSREFWPAAHRASVDSFSEALVVKWPPSCNFMSQDWSLRACSPRISDEQENCRTVPIRGQLEVYIFGLRPCSVFQIDLFSEDGSQGVSLWSFHDVKTLPVPILDITAGHDKLSLNIRQLGCQREALVHHWRLTHCDQAMSSSQKEPKLFATAQSDGRPAVLSGVNEPDGGSGSGGLDANPDAEEEREEEDFDEVPNSAGEDDLYVYDSSVTPMNGQICSNSVHTLGVQFPPELIILSNLKRCTDYYINVTPIDEHGATIQPGEQYATTHWTLCGDGQDRNHPDIWIEPDGTSSSSSSQNRSLSSPNGSQSDKSPSPGGTRGDDGGGGAIYILVVVGIVLLVLMGTAIWVTRKRWLSNGKQGQKAKTLSSRKYENDMLIGSH